MGMRAYSCGERYNPAKNENKKEIIKRARGRVRIRKRVTYGKEIIMPTSIPESNKRVWKGLVDRYIEESFALFRLFIRPKITF